MLEILLYSLVDNVTIQVPHNRNFALPACSSLNEKDFGHASKDVQSIAETCTKEVYLYTLNWANAADTQHRRKSTVMLISCQEWQCSSC
jgi:hypothetical protein